MKVGKVAHGETVTIDIAPGAHSVRMAIDWCGSAEVTIDGDGPHSLRCAAAAMPWNAIIKAVFDRNGYIRLDRA